ALGIAALHECGGPHTSDEDDFTMLLALARSGGRLPAVYGYWGELNAVAKARELGAIGAGGDLFADGALGSHTAHLRRPYADAPDTTGVGYVTEPQVAEHVIACVREGVQAGFHAIGDRALATVLGGFAAAARDIGRDRVRAGRHRIEHAELLDRSMIAAMVKYGLVASVQPAFDRLWGGAGRMYASRLGAERARVANPLAALAGVGVPLAFGSDAPVTPLDPWGTVVAATRHHNPGQRLGPRAAFAAHTRGGWRATGRDGEGALLPGRRATFAVWRAPGGVFDGLPRLVAQDPDEPAPPRPVCVRTVSRGVVIFDADAPVSG
ncbi:MAG: amidohydrolase family protein, partial [Dactylosporangium sp.]|nr:amidohydrolase family protein [Dactylosporangium sp.]NNJ63556.1 amidohydrolase family protein [Dactylosporangium sp.]